MAKESPSRTHPKKAILDFSWGSFILSIPSKAKRLQTKLSSLFVTQESHSGFFLGGVYLLIASGTNRKKAASEGMQPLHAPGKPFRIFLGGFLFIGCQWNK